MSAKQGIVTADHVSGMKPLAKAVRRALGTRSIILVGMMGSGKSSLDVAADARWHCAGRRVHLA